MVPTAGFIPAPVIPLAPAAANAIVPTAGLLTGAAAGAAAGIKYGAALGPKGLLAGAVIGGAVGLLLATPSRLAPGTLPGLDPGLNNGDPSPQPSNPITTAPVPLGESAPIGSPEPEWRVTYLVNYDDPDNVLCSDGRVLTKGRSYSTRRTVGYRALGISAVTNEAVSTRACSGGDSYREDVVVLAFNLQKNDEDLVATVVTAVAVGFPASSSKWPTPKRVGATIESITRDGGSIPVPSDLQIQQPEVKPRPSPVPILPTTDPNKPAPLPRIVPQPEPEPAPQPLEVPSPNNPDADPIVIPKPSPAPPRDVPGPDPQPLPGTTPNIPAPVPPPLPIPGTPTVPEPNPDPDPRPTPGPGTPPVPGPSPGPDPSPGTIPTTPVVPIVPDPELPPLPDDPNPTDPDGSLTPQPDPEPTPTPPDAHYPVPGAPPVTSGGTRTDVSAIAAEVGRIEQKLARMQNGQGFPDLSDLLFLLPLLLEFLEGDIPGTTYALQGVCETVGEGEPQPTAEFEVASAKNLGAVINRLDTIDQMLQQHLAWKTPTCSRRPVLAGDWRTITFISDENSGTRGDRLRKRFRYRSLSGIGLPGVIDHWANFTWQAGAVCVQHAGSTWGTPQVWAASIDEGKRVIRHAAGEAGIDPDKDGRWVISGSNSARVGLPGTMRVNRKGGYYWITARDGPDGPPIVGTTP